MSEARGQRTERASHVQRRMDEALSTARAVCLAAGFYSILAMFFWAKCEVPYLVRLAGALTALACFPFAWNGAAIGRWTFAAVIATFLFLLQAVLFGYEASFRPAPFGPPVLRDFLLVTMGFAVLTVVLTVTRLMSPARSFLVAATLAGGLLLVVTVDRARKGPAPAIAGPGRPTDRRPFTNNGAPFLGPPTSARPPMKELEWSYAAAVPDPVLEYKYAPHASIKTYYPSDPRGRMEPEPDTESLDMRTIRLMTSNGATAELVPAASRSSSVQVRVKSVAANSPWSVNLTHLAAVEAGGRYVALVWLKADRSRDATVQFAQLGTHKQIASETFSIGPGWAILALPARMPDGCDRVVVQLQLGQSVGVVDVAAVAVGRTRDAIFGKLDMRTFQPFSSSGSPPRIAMCWRDRLLVVPPSGGPREPWMTQVRYCGVPVEAGRKYSLRFRARCDGEARIGVHVQRDKPPWQPATTAASVDVSHEWRDFQLDLAGTHASETASLAFLLGRVPGYLEISGVTLLRDGASEPDAAIPYQASPWPYSVIHRMNSAGFRGPEWSPVAPPNTFRIAILGDSYTFGQGVPLKDACVSLVGDKLNQMSQESGPRFEVLNFGVCGYSTRQERLCYEEVASKYKPNLVLVAMHFNDVMSHNEELEYYKRKKQQEEGGLLSIGNRILGGVVGGPDYGVCAQELLKLRDTCRRDGVPLAVYTFRTGDGVEWQSLISAVQPAMQAAGVPFLDLGETILRGRDWKELVVHEIDGHPNEIAHRIAADSIVDFLVKNRLVPTPESTASPSARAE